MAAPSKNVFALCCCIVIVFLQCHARPPNIVFVLTDDQDVVIGGQTPIQKITKLIGEKGIIFNNMFVSSPLCCPSRSSILTGKFVHNHGALNNSVAGNCSSQQWQKQEEGGAFPVYLKKQGYTSFFAGKYLNQYGFPKTGGVKHIPPGWDWWVGLVGNSRYYGYSLSVNGTEEVHKHDYRTDYLTDIIHRRAMDFLRIQHSGSAPFFMMMSTPACHGPFTPAPQYSQNFSDRSAPRNGSFNMHGKDKHWLIENALTPIPEKIIQNIDDIFRNRWRTLLSVEDMVEDVVNTLDKKGLLDNTYIFFSSDNGYHLGQFSLPMDKRQLYEFDIRVPLMVRGPGIRPGQFRQDPVMNIDLAPTFIELSGSTVPGTVDGLSFVQILLSAPSTVPPPPFRTKFLVEHTGEYSYAVAGCPQYTGQFMGNCDSYCTCEDSRNNTFACVIELTDSQHYKYCKMQDSVNFVEMYDLERDPDEFMNLHKSADASLLSRLSQELQALTDCQGKMCRQLQQ
ncbi:N-acetylglucosamine-6-sulfatase-like [Haliotis cracherodii]|uniref:N-acetylglucosamine-6-sulfatase-like n=1 Tax=Haliotis cracherodii TaxID=6455 RepID=UPI0039E79E40